MSDSPVVKSDDTTTESNSQPNDQSEQPDESTSTKTSSSSGSDSVTSTDPKLQGDGTVSMMKWVNDLTWNEAHLFILGFYAGFVAVRPKPRHVPAGRLRWDVNEWYWKGGYVLGYFAKTAVIGAVGAKQAIPIIQQFVATFPA